MAVNFRGGGGDDREPPNNVVSIRRGSDNDEAVFTAAKRRTLKQDKEVLQGSQIEKDDAWEPFMFNPKDPTNAKAQVLKPPYDPRILKKMCQHNNTLGQMISAMEINIDGSGWTIELTEEAAKEKDAQEKAAKKQRDKERKDAMAAALEAGEEPPEDEEDDDEEAVDEGQMALQAWFEEPFPRKSFTTMRRNLRRDMEETGYGYLEVLRDLTGELTFLKRVPSDEMRMVKLDDPVFVEQTLMRGGEEVTVKMPVRERRFAQIQGKKCVYFKEYGASRELNRNTGEWAEEGETLEIEDRATEVLMFKIYDDASTPYGVPRWINQIPSVMGSRKAEELNLDFFNSGGLPPALIFIQGGKLTEEVRKQLQAYLSGKGSSMHRAGIVEVHASGGTIDSAGNVRVTVERFGADRMKDSMFEKYDERCEMRVRSAFRLPPIFVGKSQDYSYATAFASYTVAEAQVFMPERDEFDEIINNTIMRELDPEGTYEFKSMPLMVNDVSTQLEALGVVKNDIEREDLVEAVNDLTGMKLKPKEGNVHFDTSGEPHALDPGLDEAPGAEPVPGAAPPSPGAQPPEPVGGQPRQPQPRRPAQRASKMDTFSMMELVSRWCEVWLTDDVGEVERNELQRTIKCMSPDDRERFDSYCTMKLMAGEAYDPRGAVDLFSAASDIDGSRN